jgi:hypothetical protein
MPLQCLVYIGQGTFAHGVIEKYTSFSEAVTMELAHSYLEKGHNITMDNYFTTFALADHLLGKNTTMVGTLRHNKREIPPAAKCVTNRNRGDSKHYYNGNRTICSFWDKSNKPVLLLSTMHGCQVDRGDGKPAIVSYYNSTKSGVDTLDKLVRMFRSKRKCRRWPYSIFFTCVDVAIISNMKLFGEEHYYFKRELGYEMVLPHIQRRKNHPKLRETVKQAMRSVGVAFPDVVRERSQSQGRCEFCGRQGDRKTKKSCNRCGKLICV